VTKALDRLTGVVQVRVDLKRSEVIVEHRPARVDGAAIAAAIREAGYASVCSCGCSEPRLNRAQWANLGISTIG
jgi:copper chaperone CopZ